MNKTLGSIGFQSAFVALCFLALATVSTFGADWPQFHGPCRDNKSRDTGLLKAWPEGGPARIWEANGIGQGYSTVAIAGGRTPDMGTSRGVWRALGRPLR